MGQSHSSQLPATAATAGQSASAQAEVARAAAQAASTNATTSTSSGSAQRPAHRTVSFGPSGVIQIAAADVTVRSAQ